MKPLLWQYSENLVLKQITTQSRFQLDEAICKTLQHTEEISYSETRCVSFIRELKHHQPRIVAISCSGGRVSSRCVDGQEGRRVAPLECAELLVMQQDRVQGDVGGDASGKASTFCGGKTSKTHAGLKSGYSQISKQGSERVNERRPRSQMRQVDDRAPSPHPPVAHHPCAKNSFCLAGTG